MHCANWTVTTKIYIYSRRYSYEEARSTSEVRFLVLYNLFCWWQNAHNHTFTMSQCSHPCILRIPWNLSFRYIHCTGQFTPKMKANAEPHLLSSLVWIDSGIVVSQHLLESLVIHICHNAVIHICHSAVIYVSHLRWSLLEFWIMWQADISYLQGNLHFT